MRSERPIEVVLVLIMVAALFGHVYMHVSPGVTPEKDVLPFIAIPLVGTVFCMANALFLVGVRMGLIMIAVSGALGWGFEQLGVGTGMIFGRYEYGPVLGPKLGFVPMVIPAYWFMIIYVSYVVTNLIAHDRPSGDDATLPHSLFLAALGALVATAYDLGLDPYMSAAPVSAWTWFDGGEYYGVPISNFVSWIGVAFVISLVLRLIHRRVHSRPLGRVNRVVALLPVLFYVGFWLGHLTSTYLPSLRVISAIALGIPALAALSNYRRWIHPSPHEGPRA